MRNKGIKILVISLCAVLVIGTVVFITGGHLVQFKTYRHVSKELDEINALNKEGMEYPELMGFALSMFEQVEDISENFLVKNILNKNNHANLRMLCAELLEMKIEDDEGLMQLSDKNAKKLGALVLDESENSSVRLRLIETLPKNEGTAKILETVAFDKNEEVAYRALRFLNFFAPERARPIAEDFIKSEEKMGKGIEIINYQMNLSDDETEKDRWVAYLLGLLEEVKDASMEDESKESSMKSFLLGSLSQLRYSTALYAIIDCEYIDNEYKAYVIGDKKAAFPVLLEVLENSPTDHDIEMIIKAIDLAPLEIAELIEPLKVAIENSEKDYDISGLIERVNDAVAVDKDESASMYGEDNLSQKDE